MTNEQILKKAIEKAVKNGFDIWDWYLEKDNSLRKEISTIKDLDWLVSWLATEEEIIRGLTKALLFNHDFAKAFWGEGEHEKKIRGINLFNLYPEWQHHLQQMVLEKEPLKYIEKFIN